MTILWMILSLLVGVWLEEKFDLNWRLAERVDRFLERIGFPRV